jgi:hypothetical protein
MRKPQRFSAEKISLYVILLLTTMCSRSPAQTEMKPKPFFVYHIGEDPSIDSPAFKTCDERRVIPYYGGTKTIYRGEKPELEKHFTSYKPPVNADNQNGFITIRFVINCRGESGRFRMEQIDKNYQPFTFDTRITNQLLTLTQELKSWIPTQLNGVNHDSYYYLCFKINRGTIASITP